jgi:hypothetical protein
MSDDAPYQPLVTRKDHRVQHRFVEQEVTHPLGDDDIDLVDRQFDLLDLALDGGDNVVEVVVLDDLRCLVEDIGRIDGKHLLGTGSGSEHAQDAGSTTDIEHHLAFEEVFVLEDRVAIRASSHRILEHLFVDAKVCIRVPVVFRAGWLLGCRGIGSCLGSGGGGRGGRVAHVVLMVVEERRRRKNHQHHTGEVYWGCASPLGRSWLYGYNIRHSLLSLASLHETPHSTMMR